MISSSILAAVAASWLSLPVAPLNPVAEDTLPALSLHFSAGLTAPADAIEPGLRTSVKFEFRPVHPVVVRGAIDYGFNQLNDRLHPDGTSETWPVRGDLHSILIGADVLYYRGTNYLTGYLGFGLIYGVFELSPTDRTIAEFSDELGITDISFDSKLGYRIILGLRYKRTYSFEIGVAEIRPDAVYYKPLGPGRFSLSRERTKLGSFYITLGYLFTIEEW